MMNKPYFLIIFFCFLISFAQAQDSDTIRMMQYNLMYYTNNSGVSDCNNVTNNLDDKDQNIKKIFQYVKPTVFCVCEMGSQNEYADRLLNNAINTSGIDYYKRCPLTNLSGGYIANMMYYDSRKLSFYENYTVTTSYRDINGYKMYYNSSDLVHGDTIFITFWIAHLKAGTGDANENHRLVQTQRLMNKISQLGDPGNYVFSGDFNFYNSEESGYKELVEYSNSLYRFYDPANAPGYWHNNSQFTNLHTQSTHTQSDGCFVTGGLDDRFDFILVSPYLYYGSEKMHIIDGSYRALGQDGMRFNGSVLSPANNSVPSDIANALYNQSDHLPLVMEMKVDAHTSVNQYNNDFFVKVANPINENLQIEIQNKTDDIFQITLYSIDGKIIFQNSASIQVGLSNLSYAINMKNGIYLLEIINSKGEKIVKKIVK